MSEHETRLKAMTNQGLAYPKSGIEAMRWALAEIDSLRQQLAAADTARADDLERQLEAAKQKLTDDPETMLNLARDAFINKVCDERDRADALEQQLAESRADCERLRTKYEPPTGFCEHGIQEGDWCEPCNREYKAASKEDGLCSESS